MARRKFIAEGLEVKEPKKAWGIAVNNVFKRHNTVSDNSTNSDADKWNTHVGYSFFNDPRTNNLSVADQAQLAYKSGLLRTNNDSKKEQNAFDNYAAYKEKWFNDRNKTKEIELNTDNIFESNVQEQKKQNQQLQDNAETKSLYDQVYDYVGEKSQDISKEIETYVEEAKLGRFENKTGLDIRIKDEDGNMIPQYTNLPKGHKTLIPIDGTKIEDKIIKVNPFVDGYFYMDEKTEEPTFTYDNIGDEVLDKSINIMKNIYNKGLYISQSLGIFKYKQNQEFSGVYNYDDFVIKHPDWIDSKIDS